MTVIGKASIVRFRAHASALATVATLTLGNAQTLGTKSDLVSRVKSPSAPLVQPWDMLQMLVALAIVGALLKWVLPRVVGRLGRRLSTAAGSSIVVEETAAFGAGQLQIVKVRDRTLLLSLTSTGVSCLADLSKPSLGQPVSEPKAFFDYLDSADPAKAVVGRDEQPSGAEEGMSMDEAIALISAAQERIHGSQTKPVTPLDRLTRLTGP